MVRLPRRAALAPVAGKHYDSIDADVHGGLTWAADTRGMDEAPSKGFWFIGFDCCHGLDVSPVMELLMRRVQPLASPFETGDFRKYRSLSYVRGQLEGLAEQAERAACAAPCAEQQRPIPPWVEALAAEWERDADQCELAHAEFGGESALFVAKCLRHNAAMLRERARSE